MYPHVIVMYLNNSHREISEYILEQVHSDLFSLRDKTETTFEPEAKTTDEICSMIRVH